MDSEARAYRRLQLFGSQEGLVSLRFICGSRYDDAQELADGCAQELADGCAFGTMKHLQHRSAPGKTHQSFRKST